MRCALPCHLFPMFMLPCASVVYMQYAFDRLCFLTRCVSLFPLFFSIYCFVAAIYANKDVYKVTVPNPATRDGRTDRTDGRTQDHG